MTYAEYIKKQKALAEEVRLSWTKESLNEIREDFLSAATSGSKSNLAQVATSIVLAGEVVNAKDASRAWQKAFADADRNFLSDQLVTMAPTALVRQSKAETVSEEIRNRLEALDCVLISFRHGLLRVSFYDYDAEEERVLVGSIDQIEKMVNGIEVEMSTIEPIRKNVDVEVEQEKFYASTEA